MYMHLYTLGSVSSVTDAEGVGVGQMPSSCEKQSLCPPSLCLKASIRLVPFAAPDSASLLTCLVQVWHSHHWPASGAGMPAVRLLVVLAALAEAEHIGGDSTLLSSRS
jgi:hypothetical protein